MTLPYEAITLSPDATEACGESLARLISATPSLPRFVAMYGDLGVGKTAFVRGFTRFFSPSSTVKSPTFTLVNEYGRGKDAVFHFDMYRITSEDDLYSIGFYDYAARGGVSLVEWSENIPFALPEKYIRLSIVKNDVETPDSRKITIEIAEG